ncbi:uncharacterized protein [Magallana gigas]|uniref:uncharacterized protein n=1 Tax=Magallana gigas TaxID=29159 RepID=UPI003340BAF0
MVNIHTMSWSRVIWKEKDIEVEEVIPSSWIAGNKVLWPPVSNAGAKKAIRQQWTPEQKWTSFELVRIKMSSDEKKDCDIANITTCDESEESSGDEVPLGKRIPKKKSFGTEFATGSTLETDSSKTSCNNPVLPAPPQPPKRSSSKTQKSSGVANQRKAPQRISSSKSPSPARSSRSMENSRRQTFSQLSRSRSRSRGNSRRQIFSQLSRSRSRSRGNSRRQSFSQLSRSRSRSRGNSRRQSFSQLSRSRSRSRGNSRRQSFSQLSRSRSRSRGNSRRQTFSQLSRSRSRSRGHNRRQPFSQLSRSRSRENRFGQ